MKARVSRRAVLAGAGAVLASSALIRQGRGVAGKRESANSQGPTVILKNSLHALPQEVVALFAGQDARIIQLQADPVRQWRGPQAGLLGDRGTRLLGMTSWPQFLLVSGLAEESGRRVRFSRCDAASDAIIWHIA